MIKLIVFDWNGTLLADTRACMDADNFVIQNYGGKPFASVREFRAMVTIPAFDFYVARGCERKKLLADMKTVRAMFHNFYEKRACRCRLRKGARSLLRILNKKNVQCILLSNHTVGGIQRQLKRLKMDRYFAQILADLSGEAAFKKRNKQQKLAGYFKVHPYKQNEVAIIGDSSEEIEIGKKLGILSIAITDGYYATARLKALEPDFLVYNLGEVKKIICP